MRLGRCNEGHHEVIIPLMQVADHVAPWVHAVFHTYNNYSKNIFHPILLLLLLHELDKGAPSVYDYDAKRTLH
jgi:hypothetical protein